MTSRKFTRFEPPGSVGPEVSIARKDLLAVEAGHLSEGQKQHAVLVLRDGVRIQVYERMDEVIVWRDQVDAQKPFIGDHRFAKRPDRAPARCNIIEDGDTWRCTAAGCGATGTIEGDDLVEGDSGRHAFREDAPRPHAMHYGKECLFDGAELGGADLRLLQRAARICKQVASEQALEGARQAAEQCAQRILKSRPRGGA